MASIRALLVDDEPLARRGLKIRLATFEDFDIVGECGNGREALEAIEEKRPDVVFLDIQMPGIDGFDVVKALQGDAMPLVIFVTAYDQYAVDAFEVHAVDYLLKPAEEERLAQAVDKIRVRLEDRSARDDKAKLLNAIGSLTGREPDDMDSALAQAEAKQRGPKTLSIKDGGTVTLVPVEDIDWIDAAGDYMCVHVGDSIHIMRSTMKQLEAELDPEVFQRIHRSTIVNLSRVKQVCAHANGEYHLVLHGGARLKMSRTFKDKVKHFL